jgi:hypothetical protein
MRKEGSPFEIQTPRKWNLIDRPAGCVIAQQYSALTSLS